MCIYQPIIITEEIENSFRPTRLAIKELNGLKYFCKSVRKNFEKYKGSGKFWSNHIKKFGSENVRTLWISDWFYCPHHIQDFALVFGEYNKIVESSEWANLIPEYGIGGGNKYWKGKKRPDHGQKISGKNHPSYGKPGKLKGKTHVEIHGERESIELKRKLSISKLGPKNPNYGKPDIMKDPKWQIECEHCGETTNKSKYVRYHGDNCVQNPATSSHEKFIHVKTGEILELYIFEFVRDVLLPKTDFPTQSIYRLRQGKSVFGWRLSRV